MPVQQIINHSLQLNLTIGTGMITLDELMDCVKSMSSRTDFDSTYDGLCYFSSNTETDIPSTELKTVSSVSPSRQNSFGSAGLPKLAIVASQAYIHDMSRVYLATRSDVESQIFTTLQDASVWLERELLTSDFTFQNSWAHFIETNLDASDTQHLAPIQVAG